MAHRICPAISQPAEEALLVAGAFFRHEFDDKGDAASGDWFIYFGGSLGSWLRFEVSEHNTAEKHELRPSETVEDIVRRGDPDIRSLEPPEGWRWMHDRLVYPVFGEL